MGGQLVELAALLVQPHPPSPPSGVEILHLHRNRRANAREAVDQQPDKGAVAQADQAAGIDALQQLPRLGAVEHRRLAFSQ